MFLSIIIPVFNIEKHIYKCINSIMASLITDYEVILVIGKSQDKSNEICFKLELKYDNIRVCEQSGKGLSNAKNCGINEAIGKFITFIDGDDYVIAECFKRTIDKLNDLDSREKSEIIISDFIMVNIKDEVVYTQKQISRTQDIELDVNYTKQFVSKKGAIWNSWRYIYLKDFILINNLFFNENYACEDLDYAVRSILYSKLIFYYHNPYYCYCGNRPDSLFNKDTYRNSSSLLIIVSELFLEIEKHSVIYKKQLKQKLIDEIILSISSLVDMDKTQKSKMVDMYKENIYIIKEGEYLLGKITYWVIKIFGLKNVSRLLHAIKIIRRKIIY